MERPQPVAPLRPPQLQAQRLKALSAELRRASAEDLRHVRNERVARRLCRMFQLPSEAMQRAGRRRRQPPVLLAALVTCAAMSAACHCQPAFFNAQCSEDDVYVSWKRAQCSMLHSRPHRSPGKADGGGSTSLSLSPSPTKRHGKRKSPDRMAAATALRHSRFAPICSSGKGAGLPSPLVRRRSSSGEGGSSLSSYGGSSGDDILPRQLCFDCATETMDVDAASSLPELVVAGAAVPGSRGSSCPEWLLFRTALTSPPLCNEQLQQQAKQTQQDGVESVCDAEHQVEIASRILAGPVSPNSPAAVAPAVGAPLHPLSPCHRDRTQPTAVKLPGILPRRLTSGMSCAGPAVVTTVAAATANDTGINGQRPSSSGFGSLDGTLPKYGINARESAQARENAALASATVMDLESSGWRGRGSSDSESDSYISWAGSRAAGSFRSQQRGGRKQTVPSRSRLSSQEEPSCSSLPAREAMGPSSSPWVDRLGPGSIGLVADNRAYVVDAAALRAFAKPKPQAVAMFASGGRGSSGGPGSGVDGAINAMQALDVRGRGRSIVRPIALLRVAAPVSGRLQHMFPCY